MWYKKSVYITKLTSVEVEAESLEEAMKLFDASDEWYIEYEEPEDEKYYVAELDEDGDVDYWEEVEDE